MSVIQDALRSNFQEDPTTKEVCDFVAKFIKRYGYILKKNGKIAFRLRYDTGSTEITLYAGTGHHTLQTGCSISTIKDILNREGADIKFLEMGEPDPKDDKPNWKDYQITFYVGEKKNNSNNIKTTEKVIVKRVLVKTCKNCGESIRISKENLKGFRSDPWARSKCTECGNWVRVSWKEVDLLN